MDDTVTELNTSQCIYYLVNVASWTTGTTHFSTIEVGSCGEGVRWTLLTLVALYVYIVAGWARHTG